MKILITAAYNKKCFVPFISEQAEALRKLGIEIEYFGVVGKGAFGYLKNRKKLIEKIKEFQPDIIHAHYGLSGLLANLQRRVPVVTTYHGSDINNDKVFRFSKIAIRFSAFNIFVSEKNRQKAKQIKKQALIPCGVEMDCFKIIEKKHAREKLGLEKNKKLVLFAGAFDNHVKNPALAIGSVEKLDGVELIELKGYSREEVALLMNAVDVALMTSLSEGSPQFVKEAMACNCPVVSVDVGDVKDILGDTDGCFIAERTLEDVTCKIQKVLSWGKRTDGRARIMKLELDNKTVVKKIVTIYKSILTN